MFKFLQLTAIVIVSLVALGIIPAIWVEDGPFEPRALFLSIVLEALLVVICASVFSDVYQQDD